MTKRKTEVRLELFYRTADWLLYNTCNYLLYLLYITESDQYNDITGMCLYNCCCFSSMSSCLNSAAAVTWQDIINVYGQTFSEAKKTLITKFLGNKPNHGTILLW